MIFLTVGTSFPFDRLVRAMDEAVDQGKIKEEIFAQVGKDGYKPRNFRFAETLDKKRFDEYFSNSNAIVAHAGIGTITMALASNKPILVVPRLKKFKELVNDHQRATARRFEEMGHVLAVYDMQELANKVQLLNSFIPAPRVSKAERVSQRIGSFLNSLKRN